MLAFLTSARVAMGVSLRRNETHHGCTLEKGRLMGLRKGELKDENLAYGNGNQ